MVKREILNGRKKQSHRQCPPFHAPAVELTPEIEEMKVKLYTQYLEAEEQEKFEGSFQDFLHAMEREDLVEVSLHSEWCIHCSIPAASQYHRSMVVYVPS